MNRQVESIMLAVSLAWWRHEKNLKEKKETENSSTQRFVILVRFLQLNYSYIVSILVWFMFVCKVLHCIILRPDV